MARSFYVILAFQMWVASKKRCSFGITDVNFQSHIVMYINNIEKIQQRSNIKSDRIRS